MSTFMHLAHALMGATAHHPSWVLAAPSHVLAADPTPAGPAPTAHVNPNGFMNFLISWVLPILIALAGIYAIGRSKKGDMNATLTQFSIVVIGVVLIASAGVLFFAGQYLVHLVIS